MNCARIVIAQTLQAVQPIIESALNGYELVIVQDLKSAQYEVEKSTVDLFILEIQFDDSRTIELVSSIVESAKHKDIPIVVVQLSNSSLAPILLITMNSLIKLGIVNRYLELAGDVDALEKIRSAVDGLLPANKTIQ